MSTFLVNNCFLIISMTIECLGFRTHNEKKTKKPKKFPYRVCILVDLLNIYE